MFKSYKIIFAKNAVIQDLVLRRMLPKEYKKPMQAIAGNEGNLQYGIEMLDKEMVSCKYSAVAAVFARIAVYYKNLPSDDMLTSEDWRLACFHAMTLAGASEHEAKDTVKELLAMNENILAQDPLES